MSAENDIDDKPQPLLEHLIELRKRLVWALLAFFIGFLICFFFAKDLFNLLVLPYKWAVIWSGHDPEKMQLIYTAPQEFFFTQIKISSVRRPCCWPFRSSHFRSTAFVAPGLYQAMSARPFCRFWSLHQCCSS